MALLETLNVTEELMVGGPATFKRTTLIEDATASRVCTSADYGKTICFDYAGAVAVTLPANGAPAGSYIDMIVDGANTTILTVSAASANTLITFNDATATSLAYSTTAHRIGGMLRFISNGTYWVGIPMSGGLTAVVV
jgi:hypothetical protein